MNTSRKGTTVERKVGHALVADGWLVGSRRHLKGPGDWLATKDGRLRLIEVKGTRTPFADFLPDDRDELSAVARHYGAVPELAWWDASSKAIRWFPESEWPGRRRHA